MKNNREYELEKNDKRATTFPPGQAAIRETRGSGVICTHRDDLFPGGKVSANLREYHISVNATENSIDTCASLP